MSENHSAQLDGEILGEGVGDDGLPGVGDYPADQAIGVNDPNLVADDDVAMREARTRAESVPGDGTGAADEATGALVPPDGDDGMRDDVQQLLGAESTDSGEVTPAEVEAMRTTESP